MGLDAGFLAMLTAHPTLERCTGEDGFGNETYGDGETISAFIQDISTTFGSEDRQGEQDDPQVHTGSLLTDAIGIKLKDRITVPSRETPMYVSEEQTTQDEFGQPLFQTVTITTQKRG